MYWKMWRVEEVPSQICSPRPARRLPPRCLFEEVDSGSIELTVQSSLHIPNEANFPFSLHLRSNLDSDLF